MVKRFYSKLCMLFKFRYYNFLYKDSFENGMVNIECVVIRILFLLLGSEKIKEREIFWLESLRC